MLLAAVDGAEVLSIDVMRGRSTSAMHRVGIRRRLFEGVSMAKGGDEDPYE